MLGQLSALVASIVLIGLMIFQLLLVFGRPYGEYAWGGQHRVLPIGYRIGSVIAIIIYVISIIVMLESAGLISFISNTAISRYGIWVLFIYFLIGIPLNAISRSKLERYTMTPIVSLLCVLTLVVALAG